MRKPNKKLSTEKILLNDLHLLQEYIEDFWNFLPIPVCDINGVFNIINVGRRFLEFLGYQQKEIIGEDIKKIFYFKEELQKFRDTLLKKGEISNQRITLLTKHKKTVPVTVFARARISERAVVSYFVAFIDLREIEKKEEELQEKIDELEKFHKLATGRELKMVQLKEKIEQLKNQLAQKK